MVCVHVQCVCVCDVVWGGVGWEGEEGGIAARCDVNLAVGIGSSRVVVGTHYDLAVGHG